MQLELLVEAEAVRILALVVALRKLQELAVEVARAPAVVEGLAARLALVVGLLEG